MATRRRPPGEEKHEYFALKKFGSVNTQPSRTALKEDEFSWLENFMPIGDSYAPSVPAPDTATATLSGSISSMHQITIGSTDYMFCFTAAGGAEAVNLSGGTVTTVAAGTTFVSPSIDQWKSERAVIVDPTNGFFSWDGTTFLSPGNLATISVSIGGSGYTSTPTVTLTGGTTGTTASATATLVDSAVSSITLVTYGDSYTASPTVGFSGGGGSGTTASAWIMPNGQVGSAIAVYSGRVWIANGRVLSYTAPNNWVDTDTADAAGSQTITEGFLRQKVYGLKALDNYLYIFADSSIFIIGDLKVTGSITTYSFTNLSSTTGTTLPNSITSMERAILFMNKYGVYAVFGASVQKISQALDGVFPDIDFTQPVSAGLCTIYNILCYVVTFTYDGASATRTIQAVYFGGKWFFTSQGTALTFTAPAQISGQLFMYATSGTDVRKLYQDTTSTIATTMTTALMPLESAIFDKQFNRIGVEFTAPSLTTLTVQIQTEGANNYVNASSLNYVRWINTAQATVTWLNSSTQTVQWITTGFTRSINYADVVGKYLGFSITCNNPQVIINGILAEYEPRASW